MARLTSVSQHDAEKSHMLTRAGKPGDKAGDAAIECKNKGLTLDLTHDPLLICCCMSIALATPWKPWARKWQVLTIPQQTQ